jgi:hypothetical protein
MLVFLNPLFLWALAALSIPLVLHLFQRRRTVLTPFPTLRFLKLAQKRSSSRIRFENLILWLLRSLLLAALALAFAMPVIRKTAAADWLARSRRDVVIIIDTSYSMAYETERGNVLEAAKEAAAGLIDGLAPGDRVCVYLAADTPQPLIERPTTEHAAVLQAVRAVEWRPGSSSIDAAVALALHTLDQERDKSRDREIHVLTDGQALPWQGFRTASDDAAGAAGATGAADGRGVIAREHRDSIPLFALLGGAERPENTWPVSLAITPPLLLAGQDARINVRLGRTGPARQVSVSLFAGETERLNRGVLAEADAETAAELVLSGLEPGLWTGEIRTPVDALPCDDAFGFLIRIRDRLPVLVAGPAESAKFLCVALAPGGGEDAVRAVAPDELATIDLAAYEAVFLADALPLSGQAILRIEEYVRAGGVLALFAGDGAMPQAYADLPFLPAPVRGTAAIPVSEAARPIGRVSRDDAVFRNFRFPRGVVPTLALKRVLLFDPPAKEGSVVLTAGDDQPFLLARPVGRGLVFQFAVSAGRDWSTLPLTAFFVPVVHQIIRHGAGATQHPPFVFLQAELGADDTLPDLRADDRLLAPSGQEVSVRDAGNLSRVIEPLAEPGIYTRSRAGSDPEPVLVANFARAESRLDTATPDELAEWTGFKTFHAARTPEALLAAIDDLHNGRVLAEPLLWFILLLALTEWWYANRTLRKGSKLTDTLTIDPAGKVSGTT